jgi:hypothetical protein
MVLFMASESSLQAENVEQWGVSAFHRPYKAKQNLTGDKAL